MQKEDQKELARVRSARKWLSRAEERIESGDSILGKMHVLLAEAEISLFRKKHPFIFGKAFTHTTAAIISCFLIWTGFFIYSDSKMLPSESSQIKSEKISIQDEKNTQVNKNLLGQQENALIETNGKKNVQKLINSESAQDERPSEKVVNSTPVTTSYELRREPQVTNQENSREMQEWVRSAGTAIRGR